MYQYEVRFTSVEDGENFAEWYLANIYWLNESDQLNRAILSSRTNIYQELMEDERVVQFNLHKKY